MMNELQWHLHENMFSLKMWLHLTTATNRVVIKRFVYGFGSDLLILSRFLPSQMWNGRKALTQTLQPVCPNPTSHQFSKMNSFIATVHVLTCRGIPIQMNPQSYHIWLTMIIWPFLRPSPGRGVYHCRLSGHGGHQYLDLLSSERDDGSEDRCQIDAQMSFSWGWSPRACYLVQRIQSDRVRLRSNDCVCLHFKSTPLW